MNKVFIQVTWRNDIARAKWNFAMADFMNAAVILAALVNKAPVPEIRHLSEVVAVYSLQPQYMITVWTQSFFRYTSKLQSQWLFLMRRLLAHLRASFIVISTHNT